MLPPRVRTEVTGRRLGPACAAAALLVAALVLGPHHASPSGADKDRPTAELASSVRARPAPHAKPSSKPSGRTGATGQTARNRRCTGTIALTFDDGPVPGTTPRLVRVLTAANVPATFFMVGRRVRQHPELARAVERAGFQIANHSWSHEQLTARSNRQVRSSIAATDRELRRAGVHPGRLMRPPYGSINRRVRADLARTGYVPVLWTVDSRDWANGSADQIATRILGALRRGPNVVLQHDGVDRSPISVAAVTKVVRVARQRGYCFTGLDRRGRPSLATARSAGTSRAAQPSRRTTSRTAERADQASRPWSPDLTR
ncbi:MAG TPA: polysaccharide deacetylase family protein [Nocardioides sp.]|nr:polysaccharide deacetylase family protein [Nocardioides sp.]